MSGEIETYLFQKLDQAIKETESSDHNIYTKLFNLQKKLIKVQALLQPNNNAGTATTVDELKRREILYLLNNLLSQWQLITKNHGYYSPEVLVSGCKLGQKLKEIKKDLKGKGSQEASTGTRSNYGSSSISPANNFNTYRWSSPEEIDRSKVRGFDDKERFLERLLVGQESKEKFKAIAIVGELGVGKTTLCQMIFNNEKVKQHFMPRIWVCMSRKVNEEDENNEKVIVERILRCLGIQDEIIEDVSGDDPNHALQNLMYALHLQLIGNKYLIVLDDVWNSQNKHFENLGFSGEECYDQLAYGFPKGDNGKVIISTRYEEIAEKMVGEENVHRVLPMNDKEICWQIFMDSVEKDGRKFPENLKELKNNIVDKCAGLPLTAKLLGEIMNQKLNRDLPVETTENVHVVNPDNNVGKPPLTSGTPWLRFSQNSDRSERLPPESFSNDDVDEEELF